MKFFENIAQELKNFGGWDALEIIVLAFLFYGILKFLKSANALRAVKYIVGSAAIIIVIKIFQTEMPVLDRVADMMIIGLIVIICVSFISEIRRGILKLISPRRVASHYTVTNEYSDEELASSILEVVKATQTLSKNNVGALMVFISKNFPSHIIDSGVKLGATISASLLESIFNTKAPLHDGAVIIKGRSIVAAGCFLPLSQDVNLPKELGTRHRAAIGVSESYDVLTVIVSEETGVISVAQNGDLKRYYDSNQLHDAITQFYGLSVTHTESKRRRK